MKLDEKYFEQIVERLSEFEDFYFYSEAHATLIEKPEVKTILKQIAREAAEAQRLNCAMLCTSQPRDGLQWSKAPEGCTNCGWILAIPDGE